MLDEVIARGADTYPSQRQAALAYARLKLGQTREGLAAAERAVALCGDTPSDCVKALGRRAQARAALGDSGAALTDIDAALKRVEELRKQLVPTDFFKQNFHRAQEEIYSEAIALKLRQHQDESALETAELARSRAFLDLLASRGVQPKDSPLALRGPTPGTSRGVELRSLDTAPPASAGDIAATAARLRSTFILYWVAEDELVIWVVTPNGKPRRDE